MRLLRIALVAVVIRFVLLLQSSNNNVLIVVVHGFPDRAGPCLKGIAAVSGLHKENDNGRRPVIAYERIQDMDGISFLIDDIPVTTSNSTNNNSNTSVGTTLTVGETHIFAIQSNNISNSNIPFKGALIRIEQGNTYELPYIIEPILNSDIAYLCTGPGISGFSHYNNNEKYIFTGSIITFSTLPILLDITIVQYNNNTGSIYAHETITLNVIDNNNNNNNNAPSVQQPTITTTTAPSTSEPTTTMLPTTTSPTVLTQTDTPTTSPIITTNEPTIVETNEPTVVLAESTLIPSKAPIILSITEQPTTSTVPIITNNDNDDDTNTSTTTTITSASSFVVNNTMLTFSIIIVFIAFAYY